MKNVIVLFSLLLIHGMVLAQEYPVERPAINEDADSEGFYELLIDQPKQVIRGLGFEIQSDAIASNNQGLPEHHTSVPHDLVPAERQRFYDEMLQGFRYCRLAGGLYWRGIINGGRNVIERWPTQDDELAEMIRESGVEGLSLEYWSPAPFWKANEKYTGKDGSENKLKCFGMNFHEDPDYNGDTVKFLTDFANAMAEDIRHLEQNGMEVKIFGVQNEPFVNQSYSSCVYTNEQYYTMFKVVAPIIRSNFPDLEIIVDTHNGPHSFGELIYKDPETRKYVDSWVYHKIGWDSNSLIEKQEWYLENTFGKPVYQNEYEYLNGPASPARCVNTVQNIMNWFTFINSPTWYWIHALKPTYNQEASGYALGFWRPWDDQETEDIRMGHWKYNNYNWFSMVGFLNYMPWDSQRIEVKEDKVRMDNRIFAFKTPEGKHVFVVSNRVGKPFTFHVGTNNKSKFIGYRYTPEEAGSDHKGVKISTSKGPKLDITVPDMAWEFWVEQ
jgi:hypothetical protein